MHELIFKADMLPPMGFKAFHIRKIEGSSLVQGEELEPFSRRKKTILGKDSFNNVWILLGNFGFYSNKCQNEYLKGFLHVYPQNILVST